MAPDTSSDQHAENVRPECPYCDSPDTFDMGPMDDEDNPNPPHHVECNSCRCAFEWEPSDG